VLPEYDASGKVVAIPDSKGNTTRFEYNSMTRKTAVIDATGYRVRFEQPEDKALMWVSKR
jgi:YD repeat-containing protein